MPCGNHLMLVSGRVRVQQVSASGREIDLYRIGGEARLRPAGCSFVAKPC